MKRTLISRAGPPVVLVIGLLAGWEAWVRWRGTPTFVLPAPSRVAAAGVEAAPLLGGPIVVTITQTLLGLLIGAAVGLSLAFAIATVDWIRRAVAPLLIASQTFPTILLAPLLVVTFGLGPTPKVVLVALVTFFPVVVATTAGIDSADRELVELVSALGGSNATLLRVVQAPAAIPSFFSGLRIASAWAVAAAVLGQMNGGDQGLGVFINRSRSSFQVDRLYAAFVVIAVLSGLLYVSVGALGRAATPWLRVRASRAETSTTFRPVEPEPGSVAPTPPHHLRPEPPSPPRPRDPEMSR